MRKPFMGVFGLLVASAVVLAACSGPAQEQDPLLEHGRQIFRHDTFGNETFWTGTLQMNDVIQNNVDPVTALSVGLKVDVDALPASVVAGIQDGSVDLNSPQTTLALLSLDAVVGVQGEVTTDDNGMMSLTNVGITCALCHSTVTQDVTVTAQDNPNVPDGTVLIPAGNVGHRLDGWPNRDLNPGAIIALSPAVPSDRKVVYNSWGPGKYNPRFNLFLGTTSPEAGQTRDLSLFTGPDPNNPFDPFATVIPPAYGLAGINRSTFTGDGDIAHEPVGPVAYWNRYVAVTQMSGQGIFNDPRLAALGADMPVDHTNNGALPDLVTSKLPALQAYELSIEAPAAPVGSFDPGAAARGEKVFRGAGQCSTCHTGSLFTDANKTLHPESASVARNTEYLDLSATQMWRTSPLKGVWQHPPYFHDGSASTLADVVEAYDDKLNLGLTDQQKSDLVEYLKSL